MWLWTRITSDNEIDEEFEILLTQLREDDKYP